MRQSNFIKQNFTVLVLLSIFICSRIILLFLSPYIFHAEEPYIGTVAKEIIEGTKYTFLELQYSPYETSGMLSALLVIPLFLLFGISIYSLKLVGIFLSSLTLLIAYIYVKTNYGKKAALIASILLILAPPFYIRQNLISILNYSKTLFALTIIYLFTALLNYDKNKKIFNCALFGFICGLSIWIHYINFIGIISCVLFIIIFSRNDLIKKRYLSIKIVSIFIFFFLLGSLPLIYYNIKYDFVGFIKIKNGLLPSGAHLKNLEYILNNIKDLSPFKFPSVFRFIDIPINVPGIIDIIINKKIFAYFYYWIMLFFLLNLLTLKPEPKKKHMILVLYILVFLFFYIFTKYATQKGNLGWGVCDLSHYGYEPGAYFLHLIPFIIISVSISLNVFLESKKKYLKYLSKISLSILIFVGFIGYLSLIICPDKTHGKNVNKSPYDYKTFLFGRANYMIKAGFEKSFVAKLTDQEKQYFYFLFGYLNRKSPYMIKTNTTMYITYDRIIKKSFYPYYFAGYGASFEDIDMTASTAAKQFALKNDDKPYALAGYFCTINKSAKINMVPKIENGKFNKIKRIANDLANYH